MWSLSLLSEALHSLRKNPLRSFLAVLGVVIGIAAVVLMLAVGETARREVDRSIAAMGSNMLIVLSGATTAGGLRASPGAVPTLTTGDVEALARLPGAVGAAGVHPATVQIVAGNANWSTVVNGITRDYFRLREWQADCGTLFGEQDYLAATNLVVLGSTTARALFGTPKACGRIVRIGGSPFRVVGVLDSKGQTLDGRDQDDAAFLPLLSFQGKVFGGAPFTVRYAGVKAIGADALQRLEEAAVSLLRQRHRLRESEENDFTVRNLTSVAQTALNAARVMTAMLGALASISLIVGGIGIMNIMLVTVGERTKEIGLRRAVGATRGAIMAQFMYESMAICLMGGGMGVVLSLVSAWIAAKALGVAVEISLLSLLVSASFSALVGMVFGWWPAWKAASQVPADALRIE